MHGYSRRLMFLVFSYLLIFVELSCDTGKGQEMQISKNKKNEKKLLMLDWASFNFSVFGVNWMGAYYTKRYVLVLYSVRLKENKNDQLSLTGKVWQCTYLDRPILSNQLVLHLIIPQSSVCEVFQQVGIHDLCREKLTQQPFRSICIQWNTLLH